MSIQSIIHEALELLQEESVILASPEDALYFRASTTRKIPQAEPVRPLPEKKILPTPPKPEIQAVSTPPKPNIQTVPIPPKPIVAPEPPVASPPHWRNDEAIAVETFNTSSIKALYQRLFPQLPVIHTIPSDAQAKKIANRWKTKNQAAPISILYFSEPGPQKELLSAITKAIDVYFGPARLIHAETIEKEKQWEAFLSSQELKLVIACDYTLWQLTDLMQHFKESPTRTLKDIPLFLLPDLSLYLKDPSLKRSLWKAIQRNICM